MGGWQAYLHARGWRLNKKTIFIFDEAQSPLEDYCLWGAFFKELHMYKYLFAITFASYGIPKRRASMNPGPLLICFGDLQSRVTPY